MKFSRIALTGALGVLGTNAIAVPLIINTGAVIETKHIDILPKLPTKPAPKPKKPLDLKSQKHNFDVCMKFSTWDYCRSKYYTNIVR